MSKNGGNALYHKSQKNLMKKIGDRGSKEANGKFHSPRDLRNLSKNLKNEKKIQSEKKKFENSSPALHTYRSKVETSYLQGKSPRKIMLNLNDSYHLSNNYHTPQSRAPYLNYLSESRNTIEKRESRDNLMSSQNSSRLNSYIQEQRELLSRIRSPESNYLSKKDIQNTINSKNQKKSEKKSPFKKQISSRYDQDRSYRSKIKPFRAKHDNSLTSGISNRSLRSRKIKKYFNKEDPSITASKISSSNKLTPQPLNQSLSLSKTPQTKKINHFPNTANNSNRKEGQDKKTPKNKSINFFKTTSSRPSSRLAKKMNEIGINVDNLISQCDVQLNNVKSYHSQLMNKNTRMGLDIQKNRRTHNTLNKRKMIKIELQIKESPSPPKRNRRFLKNSGDDFPLSTDFSSLNTDIVTSKLKNLNLKKKSQKRETTNRALDTQDNYLLGDLDIDSIKVEPPNKSSDFETEISTVNLTNESNIRSEGILDGSFNFETMERQNQSIKEQEQKIGNIQYSQQQKQEQQTSKKIENQKRRGVVSLEPSFDTDTGNVRGQEVASERFTVQDTNSSCLEAREGLNPKKDVHISKQLNNFDDFMVNKDKGNQSLAEAFKKKRKFIQEDDHLDHTFSSYRYNRDRDKEIQINDRSKKSQIKNRERIGSADLDRKQLRKKMMEYGRVVRPKSKLIKDQSSMIESKSYASLKNPKKSARAISPDPSVIERLARGIKPKINKKEVKEVTRRQLERFKQMKERDKKIQKNQKKVDLDLLARKKKVKELDEV